MDHIFAIGERVRYCESARACPLLRAYPLKSSSTNSLEKAFLK